ncbi:unnamed protein product, partial [Mesorhabditis spiculigera]
MKVLILAAFLGCTVALFDTKSNITVRGTVACENVKTGGIKVDLMESGVITDDLLNSTITEEFGKFELFGQKKEFCKIEPFLYIYHNCRTIRPGCQTRSVYPIPANKLNSVYEMNFVILDIATADEKPINCVKRR